MKSKEFCIEIDDKLIELYQGREYAVVSLDYNQCIDELNNDESLKEFKDEIEKIMEFFDDTYVTVKTSLLKALMPLLRQMKEDNNYEYLSESIDFVMGLDKLFVVGVKNDRFIRFLEALYYPLNYNINVDTYYEFANYLRSDNCNVSTSITLRNLNLDKEYKNPALKVLQEYKLFWYNAFQNNRQYFNDYNDYLFYRITGDVLESVIGNKLFDIDIKDLLTYICNNYKSINAYFYMNCESLTTRQIDNNVTFRRHLSNKILEDYKKEHKTIK